MRYNMVRKYPIVEMKKNSKCNNQDSFIDMNVGTAAAVAGVLFVGGLMLGYIMRGYRR